MRISRDESDKGHENFLRLIVDHDIEVYLNGEFQKFVETADTNKGFIVRNKVINGIMQHENDEFIMEKIYGRVEIRAIKRFPVGVLTPWL